ncbi:DUF397 domain-containing protein [Umezawaea beigongshangensis]|uniref:DUF397 domain-containing protein n=1 Tax=Umezawaea beigongshangensis TaxID=2780383 RepID=UPI0018F10E2E|nr:DUF397 domain-containing protein [Umezawaea beigongshangensis]
MREYDPSDATGLLPAESWEAPQRCGPNGGNCVEVNLAVDGVVGLRDGKLPSSPVLLFDDDEWRAFLETARSGRYDR